MKTKWMFLPVAIIAISTLILFSAVSAEDRGAKKEESWSFEVSPYLFASALNGTVKVRGIESDIDMSFSDIWEDLDGPAFMGFIEAGKRPWFLFFEGFYVKLSDAGAQSWTGPLGNTNTGDLEISVTEQFYLLGAGRRLREEHVKIDAFVALRYTKLDGDLNLVRTTGSRLLPDGSNSVSGDQDWWDPLIGIRLTAPIAERWAFVVIGDFGGFGIGSDVTYSIMTGINWQFSDRFSSKIGYRYFYQDYSDDDFEWDMALSGPYMGVGIRF